MPLPVPSRANDPFPRSIAWSGESWENVIRHHVEQSRRGSASWPITFDDADRLCVTCHEEGPYTVRIPLPLVAWTESLMQDANVVAQQARPGQARFARGAEGSLLRSEAGIDRQDLARVLAERTGYEIGSLLPQVPDDLVDLRGTDGMAAHLRDLGEGSFAIGLIGKAHGRWMLWTGQITPAIGGAMMSLALATGKVNVVGLGLVVQSMEKSLDEIVALNARLRPAPPEKKLDPDDSPAFEP